MSSIQKYTPFIVSAMLMCMVLYFIYPHYQYYIDPDGTAYLTISKRYAAGDFQKAINGYWSPWSCWLTALLIKTGLSAIPASVIINTVAAAGFLYISQSFFLFFSIIRQLQWLLCITLALFLCYAVFWQSFDDLWECFFLLAALRLMLGHTFQARPALWVLCGLTGALAYFAKAYSFPFFIISTLCCSYFVVTDNKMWMNIFFTITCTMFLCSLPWLIALHHKYGILTTSTAGTLNMSWYLVGHPHWKQGIDLLIPPAYPDSPYYWEDPYFANGATPHFWNSFSLFGLQLLRIVYNAWKLLISMLQLSALLPFVFLEFILLFSPILNKQKNLIADFPHDVFIMGISVLLFLSGYFLINFEPRYIWYILPPCMALGALQVQNIKNTVFRNLLTVIFPLTFIIYPAHRMAMLYDEGLSDYKIAGQLKQLNIHGAFTSRANPGTDVQRMERIAYFSGNQFYSTTKQNAASQDVLKEMRRYHVNYYFVYGAHSGDELRDEQGNAFPEITNGRIIGLKIFLVTP